MSSPPSIPPPRIEFRDDYEHPPEDATSVEYILGNILMSPPSPATPTALGQYRQLAELYNSNFAAGCQCTGSCGSGCPCTRGSANYVRHPLRAELVLNPHRISADLLYECSDQCGCPPQCGNRLVQFGPRTGLSIRPAAGKRWAVVHADQEAAIPAGAFVCEYAGEVVSAAEARRRHAGEYAGMRRNYVLCLNERSEPGLGEEVAGDGAAVRQTFVDPTRHGNVGRYLNHSCEPNCEILSVRWDCPIPRLGIFTRRSVASGEELCFDYGHGDEGLPEDGTSGATKIRTPCLCASSNCRGYLQSLSYE